MTPSPAHGLQSSLNGLAVQGGRLFPPLALLCVGLAATVVLETLRARALRLDFEPFLAVTTIDAIDVDGRNEGRLVHAVGNTRATRELVDPVFGVRSQALRMWRRIEILTDEGWERSEEALTGGIGPWNADTRDAVFGSFRLDARLVRSLDEPVPLRHYRATLPEGARMHGDAIHLTGDPDSPVSGDIRVRFEVIPETLVTVLGGQRETELGMWRSKRGEFLGGLREGEHPASALLPPLKVQIEPLVWIGRAGLLLGLFWGSLWFCRHLSEVLPSGPVPDALTRDPRRTAVAFATVLYLATAGACWSSTLPQVSLVLVLSSLAILLARAFFLRQSLRSSISP